MALKVPGGGSAKLTKESGECHRVGKANHGRHRRWHWHHLQVKWNEDDFGQFLLRFYRGHWTNMAEKDKTRATDLPDTQLPVLGCDCGEAGSQDGTSASTHPY
jgi:hypothetical protein